MFVMVNLDIGEPNETEEKLTQKRIGAMLGLAADMFSHGKIPVKDNQVKTFSDKLSGYSCAIEISHD